MSKPGTKGTVLVLEDDPGIRRLQRSHLERAGYEVRLAANTVEARDQIALGVDLLLLDYQLADSENGLVFYRELTASGRDLPAILVTGFSDEARILEAMRAGVRDFIPKTPNFVDLVAPTVDRVMEQVRQDRRLHAAEAASRAKDNFLATLSHELRTPLTPVAALVSALRTDERLPADVRSDLEVIHRNIALESRLIDDLLDLTRIARGKLELRMEAADLRPVIQHALTTVCDAGDAEKKVSCSAELAPESHSVKCDPARVTQVFWNLLRNAVKFTPDGGSIRVRSRVDGGEGAKVVVVEVRDTGIGIEPEVLPRIFGAFQQADRGITRQFGGLGLGLAISKAIVEAHGGKLVASSEGVGKGSTFTVLLPLTAEAPSTSPLFRPQSVPAESTEQETASAHILLVEDHRDTALVLSRMLQRAGYRVSVATSVAEALGIAEPSALNDRTHRIDLLVSDLGLPDGTGIDLMSTLREVHAFPGIALSGFGMDEDVRRALNAGFSRHITKPVDIGSLLQSIRELLEQKPS